MYLYIIWYTHRWERSDQYLFSKKLNKKELRAYFRKKQFIENEIIDYMLVSVKMARVYCRKRMKHIRYPEIEQFRNAIHKVTCAARHTGVDAGGDPIYDHTKVLPTLTYEGTVKLHGTNAAICFNIAEHELWFQSWGVRSYPEKDDAGFVQHFFTGGRCIKFPMILETIMKWLFMVNGVVEKFSPLLPLHSYQSSSLFQHSR